MGNRGGNFGSCTAAQQSRRPEGEASECVAVSQESFDSPIDRRSDYYRQRAREDPPPGEPPDAELQPLLTAPNVLTLLRIALVPVVVALWFSPHRLAPLAAAAVFITAALTDWADGVLARKVRLLGGLTRV